MTELVALVLGSAAGVLAALPVAAVVLIVASRLRICMLNGPTGTEGD